jgi:hypothetical protein
MLASERLLQIEAAFSGLVQGIVPLDLDGQTIRLIMYLSDGTNLRIAEQWNGTALVRYSYYWLSSAGELKIGWDNAPHHSRLTGFPHHRHVDQQTHVIPSSEMCLEDVMQEISSFGR